MAEKELPRRTVRPKKAREIAERVGCSVRTVQKWWAMPREEYEANSYSRTKPWEHFGYSRATWYRRGKPMPETTQTNEWRKFMPKVRTDKRPFTARKLAEKFNCTPQTVRNFWSQSRADYLAENTISRDKPWEHFGISRRTWYNRGKPMPETKQTNEKE